MSGAILTTGGGAARGFKLLTNALTFGMNLDRVFEALASRARRQMLGQLAQGELTTTELARRFALSTPAVSRHLSVLENAGLVASRRQGQRVLYALVRDTLMEALSGFAGELGRAEGQSAKKQREAI
jgi:DNA-binding transcriptional ArsR family regulator